jgi:heptosyltransferase-2
MTRTLFIAPQWIGDAVMTEPLLRELHQRGEQITVAALNWVAPVYQHMPSVAEVIELPFKHGKLQWSERRALARQWRGMFERAYVAPNSFKSALIPWLARIPERIGYHGESRYGLLTQRLPSPPRGERPPMVDFYLALSGTSTYKHNSMQPVLQRATASVRQSLQAFGLEGGAYTVIAPGAEYGPAKMWPAQLVADLCQRIQGRVVLLASTKESDLCQSIADMAASSRVLNLGGKTSLSQAFDLISAARDMVSNDSGLMHVAAALGVPQVALFGSSSPHHTPPLSDKAHVVWLADDPQYTPALDCAPCYARTCQFGHTRCLNDIRPERVAQLLQSL